MVLMAVSNVCAVRFRDGLVEKEYQDILFCQSNPWTLSLIPAGGGESSAPTVYEAAYGITEIPPGLKCNFLPVSVLGKVMANSSHPCSLSLHELSVTSVFVPNIVPGREEGMDMHVRTAA